MLPYNCCILDYRFLLMHLIKGNTKCLGQYKAYVINQTLTQAPSNTNKNVFDTNHEFDLYFYFR